MHTERGSPRYFWPLGGVWGTDTKVVAQSLRHARALTLVAAASTRWGPVKAVAAGGLAAVVKVGRGEIGRLSGDAGRKRG